MSNDQPSQFKLHLALGTISFIVCFAAWGLISAFAPEFRKIFQLSATQTAALVAAPVLLGSLARLPFGMLTFSEMERAGAFSCFRIAPLVVKLVCPSVA